MARKKKLKDRNRAKPGDVLLPLVCLLLIVFLVLGGVQVATQNGWTLGNIGIPPIQSGSNGSSGTAENNPSNAPTAVIPTGQVSFDMAIVAYYSDGSNETLYERSTLPNNVAWIPQVHGKNVDRLQGNAVAAIATDTPLPANSIAHFKMNFTVFISRLNMSKWMYREEDVPLVAQNTVALAILPPFPVYGNDVFPSTSGLSGSEVRAVTWKADVSVTVRDPNGLTVLGPLAGIDLSQASFNLGGNIQVCTDCAPPAAPVGPTPAPPSGKIGGIDLSGGSGGTTNVPDPCSRSSPPSWCTQTTTAAQPTQSQLPQTTTQTIASATWTNTFVSVSTTAVQTLTSATTSVGVCTVQGCTGPYTTTTVSSTSTSIGLGTTTSRQVVTTPNPYGMSYTSVLMNFQTGQTTYRTYTKTTKTDPKTGQTVVVPTSTQVSTTTVSSSSGTYLHSTQTPNSIYGNQGMDWVWTFDSGGATYRLNLTAFLEVLAVSVLVILSLLLGRYVAVKRRRKH